VKSKPSKGKGDASTTPAPAPKLISPVLANTARPISDSVFWTSQPKLPDQKAGSEEIMKERCQLDKGDPAVYNPPDDIQETNPEKLELYHHLDQLYESWTQKRLDRATVASLYSLLLAAVKERDNSARGRSWSHDWWLKTTFFRASTLPKDSLKAATFFANQDRLYRKIVSKDEGDARKAAAASATG
jgi:hypothetical protein